MNKTSVGLFCLVVNRVVGDKKVIYETTVNDWEKNDKIVANE